MKSLFVLFAILFVSGAASANDGGIAAIKVEQIRMRETAIKNGQEVIVKKIAKPSFKILIEGGEAEKLQKILPSQVSVITSMQPEIAKDFNESFKSLGIYSEGSAQASPKVMTISCSNAEMTSVGDDGKVKIVKTGKSECTISINSMENSADAADSFGDAQTFEPKSCN